MLMGHHATRLEDGKKAMARLRRLTGQAGLSPANCRMVMTVCIQTVAMFGPEPWWNGDYIQGTIVRAEELQQLVNQEARATTGCFRTTNLGALSTESGLRATTAQLEDRQRHFGLRLLSLPQGDQAGRWWEPQRESGGGSQMPSHTADRQRVQCCWRSRKPSMRNYYKTRRP